MFHDVYVHRSTRITHEILARAAVVLLPDAVVTGCSAAVLWGVEIAGPGDDVEVTLPAGSHMVRVQGLHTRRAVLDPAHVRRRRGVATTSPEATAVRLGAALPQDAAVIALDQLIATGAVDLLGVRRQAALARGQARPERGGSRRWPTGWPNDRRQFGSGC